MSIGQSCSYEVPFSGLVQADPSFDEMKEVVVIKRMRPSIHNQWKSDEVCAYPLGKGQVRDYWGGGGGGGGGSGTGEGCGGEISGLTPLH